VSPHGIRNATQRPKSQLPGCFAPKKVLMTADCGHYHRLTLWAQSAQVPGDTEDCQVTTHGCVLLAGAATNVSPLITAFPVVNHPLAQERNRVVNEMEYAEGFLLRFDVAHRQPV
jgi:hypothetical protein